MLVPTRPVRGARGAVVAPHHLATAAGAATLRAGGNAVDAAIATNAALAVVTSYMCGIGGDAFWLIWSARDRRELALNGSGRSAAAADAAVLRRLGYDEIPLRGPLAITVPGAVRSWADAHARYGRLPFATLLEPAIELADGGFAATDGWIRAVTLGARTFPVALGSGAAGWLETFLPEGGPPAPGDLVRLPALAATLRRIADAGAGDFYEGDLGERQARFLADAGSPIRGEDLAAHASTWADPISTTYRGVKVTSHPPNSSGVVALQLLNVLERFEPPARGFVEGGGDLRWTHLTIEAAKLALLDRDRWLTDGEIAGVPVARLLDKAYAAGLAAEIDPGRAARPADGGDAPRNRIGGGTVYLATADAEGNAVSLIESNYMGFGSGVVDPATGISYQNRGSYFSLESGHPNVLAPRKRTLHTLLPGMLFRGGEPWVVAGSMGGDAQPAIHAQLVSALVDGAEDVATAVGAPRVSAEAAAHFGARDLVVAEPRFGAGLLDGLAAMGHRLEVAEAFDSRLGHCHAIEIVRRAAGGAEGGEPAAAAPASAGPGGAPTFAAATDPRSEGLPAVP